MPQLTPEQPRSKGVAVLLAGLLGMFGAHLFYLGNARRASTYLITTLVCIGLVLIAIPVANSAAFGSGIGGAFVGIFLLLLGFGGIAFTYLKALVDGVRILTDSLPY
ncbi:TM2 domain-containing protein [Hymenobacter sp. UYCo722]|uniref:TM2 domain-containing protein n=1 Tax=Hymenobacter sp. UYCo722 TaxID=3156335 RepID=UPI00339A9A49